MTQPKPEATESSVLSETDAMSLGTDLIWGVRAISLEINRTERQTFHLLETGRLPAKKVGGRWCSRRTVLGQFFGNVGEVA